MATTADPYSDNRATGAPISVHPAFPAIVALWFAALLGLGSLVLPVGLMERLVTVSGIASLVPSAEPPLGFTARAGIALAAAIAGALIGMALARKVAASSAPQPTERSFSLAAERKCRPISAHDELGEERFEDAAPPSSPAVQKRRALAIAEENCHSDYLHSVPLPGQPVETPSPDDMPLAEPVAAEATAESDGEPLELGAFTASQEEAELEQPDAGSDAELEALRRDIHAPDGPAMQDSPMTDRTFRHSAAADGEEQVPQPTEPPPVPQAFAPASAEPDPLPFAAPSLRRSLPDVLDEDQPIGSPELPEVDAPEEQEFSAKEPAPQLTVVEADGGAGADDRPLDELGLVQLTARLGASIEKRRAWLAERQEAVSATPSPTAVSFTEADDFEAVGAEDAARAIADFFGPAATEPQAEQAAPFTAPDPQAETAATTAPRTAIPAPLRGLPLKEGDDDGASLAASLSLPLTNTAAEITSEGDNEGYDEEDADDGDYSSLLEMKNPFVRQQEFVRVEVPEDESGSIEPAVTFPSQSLPETVDLGHSNGHGSAARPFYPPKKPGAPAVGSAQNPAPQDLGDAERNLRDALATLQRMSGAA